MMFYWNVRSLQVLLVNNVVNSFSLVASDLITRFRIFNLFIMLYGKVLSFNIFLIFFCFPMSYSTAVQALFDMSWINRLWSCNNTSFLIMTVLKFITQIEISSILVNIFHLLWILIISLSFEIMFVVCLISMNNLMFRCTFFCSKSKSNGQFSVRVIWHIMFSSSQMNITFSSIFI